MTKFFTQAVMLSLLFLAVSCGSDDDDPPSQTRTIEDIEADFENINLSPGIEDVSLEMFNGEVYNFRVISPERNNGELRPLILTLHGPKTKKWRNRCRIKPRKRCIFGKVRSTLKRYD